MNNWYKKYISIYNKPFLSIDKKIINEIKGKLQEKNCSSPIASVMIIAHNEEKRILACIWSLTDNICRYPIEICVINNRSDDHTENILREIGIKTFFESRKSPGFARQCGLNHAQGKYYICIDADTIYPPHYIETMIEAMMRPNVVAVYGLWSFIPDKDFNIFKLKFYEKFRDCYLRFQNIKRPELNVRGMVFAFDTQLAKKYGFRTDIIRGEDGYLALNLKNEGKLFFITDRNARPITDNSIFKIQGSFTSAIWLRMKKAFHNIRGLLHHQDIYLDQENNMIHK